MQKYKNYKVLSLASAVALASACMTGQVSDAPNESGDETTDVVSAELVGCPTGSNATDQARTVAGTALDIVNAYHKAYGWTVASTAISAQYYRPAPNGGIEFVPTSAFPLNQNNAQAALEFAQKSPSVAKYLLDGLNRCRAQTNGERYMIVEGLERAAEMHGGARAGSDQGMCPSGVGYDRTNPLTHYCFAATWTDQAWCGQRAITVRRKYKNWSPNTPTVNGDPKLSLVSSVENRSLLQGHYGYNLDRLNGNRAAYKGSANLPCTPFEGPNGVNPYFIMAYNGAPKSFSDSSLYALEDCRFKECIREIDVDPVAYMENAESYNATGLQGSLSNPFALVETAIYASPKHANSWATRVIGGGTERGQFATPVVIRGVTKYKFERRD